MVTQYDFYAQRLSFRCPDQRPGPRL